MCGLVGAINGTRVVSALVDGLKRLEYRGYDSAGLAVSDNQSLRLRKAEGPLAHLERELARSPIEGRVGIAHTRWATHGAPSVANAHPHRNDELCVVHNGIIENYEDLRTQLEAEGFVFHSETDTEVVPHLVSLLLSQGFSPEAAAKEATARLHGSSALAFLFEGEDDFFCATRSGSPLAIGEGENAMFVASDAIALAPLTEQVRYLENGDFAVVSQTKATIRDGAGQPAHRPIQRIETPVHSHDKGAFQHFMTKEIHEQPAILNRVFSEPVQERKRCDLDYADLDHLSIVACGTSCHAGEIARYWFERYTGLRVDVDIASEYRYRPLRGGGAALFISQSGETADTLAALEQAKSTGQNIFSLVNVADSSIARASDHMIRTLAGPEIGVASTKAFTAQLGALARFVIAAGQGRKTLTYTQAKTLKKALNRIPEQITALLSDQSQIDAAVQVLADKSSALFIGRGVHWPLAREGALKLKEISYIHAEGLSAGELKHGPIALVDHNLPVIALAPPDDLQDKTLSNVKEVQARGGQIILISDAQTLENLDFTPAATLTVPHSATEDKDTSDLVTPFLYSIPLQLLAQQTALVRGCDIDRPRNLAKSVTVE